MLNRILRERAVFFRGDGIWKSGIGAILDPLGFDQDGDLSFRVKERSPARSTVKVDSSLVLYRQGVGLFVGCTIARCFGDAGRSCDLRGSNARGALVHSGVLVIRGDAELSEVGDKAAIRIVGDRTRAGGQVVQDNLGWKGFGGSKISKDCTKGDVGSLREGWADK
jgi:hypothetical protein